MALLLKGHSEHINVIVRQRRMDSRSPIGSGTGQAGMAFLVGARLWRTKQSHPTFPIVPTRRLPRHFVPRKDILILYLSPPMSLLFYFMSLRGHPKEAAAISPSSVKYLQARGDCGACSERKRGVLLAPLLAMTRLVAPFSLCHCPPEADGFPLPDRVGDRSGGNGISGGRPPEAAARGGLAKTY